MLRSLAAALPSLSSRVAHSSTPPLLQLLPPAGRSTLAMQVRHLKHAKTRAGTWWQPRLPALANEMCPNVEGKGNRKKRNTQKLQQIVTDHARRKEGVRRKHVYQALKLQEHHERTRQVYRDYAEELRARANRNRAAAGPSPGAENVAPPESAA